MVAGAQRALCHPGDVQVLGMPAGAVTGMVGAYGAELQTKPADPCLMGLGVLACLDSKIVFRKGDKALAYRVVAQGSAPSTELIFEPSLLLDDGDYAAAGQAIRQIANRVDPLFKEAIKSFTAFIDDQVAQALAQCVLGKSQQQAKAERIVSLLDSSKMLECAACGAGILSSALFWDGILGLSGPVSVAVAAKTILKLWGVWPFSLASITMKCTKCFRGGGGSSVGDKGGGGECITSGSGPNKTLMRCPPNWWDKSRSSLKATPAPTSICQRGGAYGRVHKAI